MSTNDIYYIVSLILINLALECERRFALIRTNINTVGFEIDIFLEVLVYIVNL